MNKLKISLLLLSIVFVFSFKQYEMPKPSKNFKGPDLFPSDWEFMKRTYPFMTADPKAHIDAIKEAQEMRKIEKLKMHKLSDSLKWEFVGPVNISGRISDIEFNPLNDEIVYAGASTGGVFKSYDRGVTWHPIFDDQAVLPIGDIAVNPIDTNIIYVGTGEPNGSHNNFPGGGIFKSINSGETWENIGLELTSHIGRIVINPINPQIVFVAAVGSNFGTDEDRGVFKTIDGGETWEKILFVSDSTGAIDILIDPTNPDFLLAAMWERYRKAGYGQSETSYGPTSGIFRTYDSGLNWEKLGPSNGLPDDNSGVGRIGLAISQSNPAVMVAVYNDGGYYTATYKTENRGDTWQNIDPFLQVSNGTSSFSWYFGQVRIHPENPDIIYILDVYPSFTENGGETWEQEYTSNLHVDHHALAFSPKDPSYMLIGNDGGINISDNSGSTWSEPSYLPITQFYEIGLDFLKPERIYGGTQDNNSIRTPDGGIDNWQRLLGGDGFYVNVDYTNSSIIYCEYQYGNLFKSTDDGNTFNYAMNGISQTEPKNWSTPVVMDPNNPLILYYGTNRVYRTENGANFWEAISDELTKNDPLYPRFNTITTISVAPSNSDYIYVGTDEGNVWVSKDYGNNWTKITEGLPDRWVTRVAVDPINEETVYTTFSGLKWRETPPTVFRSTDAGSNWKDITNNLPKAPVNAIAVDFRDSDILFVGTDVGMYYSYNAGEEWFSLQNGMPLVSIYDLKIHPTENFIVAGTHGRSMYKLDITNIITSNYDNSEVISGFSLSQNYPNPFNPATVINFSLPETEQVSLKIYNLLGEQITELVNEMRDAGNYEVQFDASDLSSGVYFYSIQAGEFTSVKKMMLVK